MDLNPSSPKMMGIQAKSKQDSTDIEFKLLDKILLLMALG